MTRAVRGAIKAARNDRRVIHAAGVRLMREIMRSNAIRLDDIVSVMFSLTPDLDAGNPATGMREAGFSDTPLFCVQEASVEGSMPGIIRALVTFECEPGRKPTAVYLDGAEALRPDLDTGRTAT